MDEYKNDLPMIVFDRQFQAFADEFYAALPILQALWNKSVEGAEGARRWDHEWSPTCAILGHWVRDSHLYDANKPRLDKILEDLHAFALTLSPEDSRQVHASLRCFWDDLTPRQQKLILIMAAEPERRWSGGELAKKIGLRMTAKHVFKHMADLQALGVVKRVPTGYGIDLAPQSAPYEVLAAAGRRG